jgi:hypothetical protein
MSSITSRINIGKSMQLDIATTFATIGELSLLKETEVTPLGRRCRAKTGGPSAFPHMHPEGARNRAKRGLISGANCDRKSQRM